MGMFALSRIVEYARCKPVVANPLSLTSRVSDDADIPNSSDPDGDSVSRLSMLNGEEVVESCCGRCESRDAAGGSLCGILKA